MLHNKVFRSSESESPLLELTELDHPESIATEVTTFGQLAHWWGLNKLHEGCVKKQVRFISRGYYRYM